MAKKKSIQQMANEEYARRQKQAQWQSGCGGTSILLIGMLPVFLIGLLLFISGGLILREWASSQVSWETTNGTVVSSSLDSRYEAARRSCDCWKYWVNVDYSYVANGQTYTSDRVDFRDQACIGDFCLGDTSDVVNSLGYGEDQAAAQQVFAQYPQGAPITVYYDPSAPQNAVLKRETDPLAYGFLFGGVVLLIFSVGYWVSKVPA